MTTELIELMGRRRTIRDFQPREVDEASLDRVLEAGTLSPSGADKLPFIIIKVLDEEAKIKIREGAEDSEREYHQNSEPELKRWFDAKGIDHQKQFLTQAPLLLVIAGDTTKPYWRESTWLSIAYMLLAIESEGLGTVTYTPSETGFLNRLLDIPEHYHSEVILPIGYPLETLPIKKARGQGRVFEENYNE